VGLACIPVIAALAAGCGSAEKKTVEDDFRTAIDVHLAQDPKCIGEPAITFPAEVPTGQYLVDMSRDYAAKVRRMDALVRLGLLSARVEGENTDREKTTYDLTSTGREVHRQVPPGRWDPSKPVAAFCYGTAAVDSIVRFTEPSDELGQETTEVTYTYRLKPVLPWAEDPELRQAYPYLEQELATRSAPGEAKVTLEHASDGWRVMTMP
jgi:hypothetical protein